MLKFKSYLLIALAVYSVTVISALPASLAMKPLKRFESGNFQVQSLTGTFWQGRILAFRQGYPLSIDWELHPWSLLLLKLDADVRLKSSVLDAKARLSFGFRTVKIESLSGLAKAKELNPVFKAQGVSAEIANDLYLQNITLARSGGQFTEVQGLVTWDGGMVKSNALSGGQAMFPQMEAKLHEFDQGVTVSVIEKNKGEGILDIDLNHQGQAHLKIRERVSEYVSVPSQLLRGDPDGVVFEIKRQVFSLPGGL